jgi:hypothetical protein
LLLSKRRGGQGLWPDHTVSRWQGLEWGRGSIGCEISWLLLWETGVQAEEAVPGQQLAAEQAWDPAPGATALEVAGSTGPVLITPGEVLSTPSRAGQPRSLVPLGTRDAPQTPGGSMRSKLHEHTPHAHSPIHPHRHSHAHAAMQHTSAHTHVHRLIHPYSCTQTCAHTHSHIPNMDV